MKLRNACKSWDEIARLVGEFVGYKISPSQCAEDYRIIMMKRARELHQETDSHRIAALERLDKAQTAIMEKVDRGDLDAIDVMIKLETRRTRLLGTDMPTKHEVEDKTKPRLSAELLLARITELQTRIKEREALKAAPPQLTEGGVVEGEVVDGTALAVPSAPNCDKSVT